MGRPGTSRNARGLVAPLLLCGCVSGGGDERVSDARVDSSAETSSEASPDVLFPVDETGTGTSKEDAAPSCLSIHLVHPSTPSGVYWLNQDGTPYRAFCEMTLDGGGWTAFFAGVNGSKSVFAHFEDTKEICPDPETKCLRRIPAVVPPIAEMAATCGVSTIKFTIGDVVRAYFQSGTQAKWQPLGSPKAIAGSASATLASFLWTGDGGNKGWIVTSKTSSSSQTLATSYDSYPGWDYCAGTADTSTPVKLFYR